MAFNTLRFDVDGDGIALITINRPDKLNSLSTETLDEIDYCFTEAARDSDVKRLPRIVGRGFAIEMILTADRISARRAFEIGLVNRIYPAGTLLDGTKDLVRKIVAKAPLALAMALEAARSSDLPLSEGLRYEASLFGRCCATEDFTEGIDAFLQRREPKFKGQ